MQLVERDRELEALWEAFGASRTTRGRVALVAGEAGVGKTTLVRAFADEAATRTRVRWGTCDPLATPRPHGPLRDIAAATGGELAAALARGAGTEELRGVFLDLLRARPAGTVVVVEDVHWADEATLDLLRYAARRLDGCPALLVLTHRDDELAADHPLRALLGDLARSPVAVRVGLRPLSLRGVEDLAAAAGTVATVDPVSLHRVTGGNPFFVTEVLATGRADRDLPATVRDAVLARAARLAAGARAALEVVALARPPVPTTLVTEVAGVTPDDVDEAVTRGVLTGVAGTVAFRHDLARQVVATAVPPARAAELHRRTLAWLEGRPDAELADLAHHAEGTGDAGATLRYARLAAEHATSLGANREAAAQYARALRAVAAVSGPEELAELLEARSLACYLIDDPGAAVACRRRAVELRRELGEPRPLGDGLRWLSRMCWVAGRNPEAEAAAREALEVLAPLGASRELAMAHSNLAQLAMLGRDVEGARRHGETAIRLAEERGDTETAVHALNNVGSAEYLVGQVAVGREKLERSLELARRHGYHDHAARAYCNLASGIAELRGYDLAAPYLHEGIEYCADHQQDYFGNYLRAWRARVAFEQGRWDEATSEAEEVLDHPGVAAVTRIVALTVLGRVAVRRGEDGTEALDAAWELAAPTGDLQRTWPAAAGLAERSWWEGDPRGVADVTAEPYELALRIGHPWAVGELGHWRRQAGGRDPLPDDAASPYRHLAAGEAAAAAAEWERIGAPYERAVALAALDDESELRDALGIARGLRAKPLADLVAARLREVGGAVPRGPRSSTTEHPFGLTPRQAEVHALLTQGLTDAEIAERLFISPKTVGHHVSAVLRRLGLRSRVEVVVASGQPSSQHGEDSRRRP